MKVKLKVDGITVNLGIDSIKELSSCLGEKPEFKDVFHQMALSEIAHIRENIAWKDKILEKTARLLLRDTDHKVLEQIVSNEVAQQIATDDDIDYIIEHSTQSVIKNLIENLSRFENIDIHRIYFKVLKSNNADILLTIAENYDTPKKILKQLLKHEDIDIARVAKERLE